MNNRSRYTMEEVRRNTFFQLPKFLFEDELKNLSNDARVLYALLRDRHELSIKNKWVNEKDEVYLIFSRENMCEMLNLSKPTITKIMNELKKYNLIEETRLGQGKPNRIYLLMVATPLTYDKRPQTIENTETEKNFTSESKGENPEEKNFNFWNQKNLTSAGKENLHPEVKNFAPINTEVKEINSSETDSHQIISNRIIPPPVQRRLNDTDVKTDVRTDSIGCDATQAPTVSNSSTVSSNAVSSNAVSFNAVSFNPMSLTESEKIEKGQKNKAGLVSTPLFQRRQGHITKPTLPRYSVADIEEIIKENIEYDNLIENKIIDGEILDEIVFTVVHTICNEYPDGYIKLGNELVFAEAVRSTFFKLTVLDIEYFVECFNKQTNPITRLTAYIRKSLFYNHGTLHHYYGNRVLVNMPQLAK